MIPVTLLYGTPDDAAAQMSSQIGVVRELVSRNLSRLQAQGIILVDGKTILIPSLEALQAEAEDTE